MRSEMAQPCWAPSASVRRMRRSRVPCGRLMRDSPMVCALPFRFYRRGYAPGRVEAQGEQCSGGWQPRELLVFVGGLGGGLELGVDLLEELLGLLGVAAEVVLVGLLRGGDLGVRLI